MQMPQCTIEWVDFMGTKLRRTNLNVWHCVLHIQMEALCSKGASIREDESVVFKFLDVVLMFDTD